MKCIICRKEKEDMTDEHVIPYAIGGEYHIYSVCKTCNSILGDNVDILLINNWFTIGRRHIHSLAGRSKQVPNPLVGKGSIVSSLDSDEERSSVRMDIDDEGVLTPYLIPYTSGITTDENGRSTFHISLDAKDEKDIDKIVTKILKRNGIDPSKVKLDQKIEYHKINQPIVRQTIQIGIKDFKIGILKIAYEFAVDKIPDYFEDSQAKVIANILINADWNAISDDMMPGPGFAIPEEIPMLHEFIDYNDHRHVLMLFNFQNCLTCYYRIFDLFAGIVKLSDKPYTGYDGMIMDGAPIIIAINDFKTRTCVFYNTIEFLNHFTGGGNKL